MNTVNKNWEVGRSPHAIRDERLRKMPPDARTTYERIRKLRGEIGPLDFDIVESLRTMRSTPRVSMNNDAS